MAHIREVKRILRGSIGRGGDDKRVIFLFPCKIPALQRLQVVAAYADIACQQGRVNQDGATVVYIMEKKNLSSRSVSLVKLEIIKWLPFYFCDP